MSEMDVFTADDVQIVDDEIEKNHVGSAVGSQLAKEIKAIEHVLQARIAAIDAVVQQHPSLLKHTSVLDKLAESDRDAFATLARLKEAQQSMGVE
jgi:hypothetical protein